MVENDRVQQRNGRSRPRRRRQRFSGPVAVLYYGLSRLLWLIIIGHLLHFLGPFVAKSGDLASHDWAMSTYMGAWNQRLSAMPSFLPEQVAWAIAFLVWGVVQGFLGYGSFAAAVANRFVN